MHMHEWQVETAVSSADGAFRVHVPPDPTTRPPSHVVCVYPSLSLALVVNRQAREATQTPAETTRRNHQN